MSNYAYEAAVEKSSAYTVDIGGQAKAANVGNKVKVAHRTIQYIQSYLFPFFN